MHEETVAEAQERRLNSVAQPIAGSDPFLLAGLAPALQRAIGGRRAGPSEAARMHEEPKRREIGEILFLEDRAQIGFDEGGARQALVVAHEPQAVAVAAKAPAALFAGVHPVLDRRGGRAPAAVGGQVIARPVEFVRWRHHHNRHSSAEPIQRHGEMPAAEDARADTCKTGEAKHVTEEIFDEFDGGGVGWMFRCGERGEQRLADAEVTRDLVAKGEALRNAVIGFALPARLMRRNARQRGRSRQTKRPCGFDRSLERRPTFR